MSDDCAAREGEGGYLSSRIWSIRMPWAVGSHAGTTTRKKSNSQAQDIHAEWGVGICKLPHRARITGEKEWLVAAWERDVRGLGM